MTPDLYDRFADRMEDFWGRREHAAGHERIFHIFGWPVVLSSDYEPVLDAGGLAEPLYSRVPPLDREPFRIRIAVSRDDPAPAPVPESLIPLIRYTGSGDWIHIDLGAWGQAFAELRRGEAAVVLSAGLAARPDLVTLAILNTLLTNFLTRHGYAMLHATGLIQGDRVLLLMAPHNSGKSTTALRLVLGGGFGLLTDSMVYVSRALGGVQLTGFPVGRGKLRRDMLPAFPGLRELLSPEQVRDEVKFVLDLRRLDPRLVCEGAVFPRSVDWCLLTRTDRPQSALRPATEAEAWEAIMTNSLHYDEPGVWEENLREIEPLVKTARFWHLELGKSGEDVVEVMQKTAG
jgi:hypothetical protein